MPTDMPTDGIHCASLKWRDGLPCEVGDQVVRADHQVSGWLIWGCCQVGEKKVGLVDPHGIKRWALPDCFILLITAMDGVIREVERRGEMVQYDINLEPLL